MRAAVLNEYGSAPVPAELDDPPAPAADELALEVEVAGLNPVDRSMASGSFYGGTVPTPYVVGREGVGRTREGRRVYFDAPVAPHGSFAERTLVHAEETMPVGDDVEPALAVACGIAGLAAWLGLDWRADLSAGERVLILGASGVVGQIGVQAAKLLGAARVVAAARDEQGLERARALGADAVVPLRGAAEDWPEAFRVAADGELDVVLDPLWGEPAVAALKACGPGARLVQLGQSAGAEATIPSAAIRGGLVEILGHTNLRAPTQAKREAFAAMLAHAAAGELSVGIERWPLERVGEAWERQAAGAHHKLVVEP